jgi:surface antigen
MKKNLIATITAITISCAISTTPSYAITNQDIGTVTGGVIGGVAGSQVFHGHGQTAGVIGGVIVGAILGGTIGKSMDNQDRRAAQNAMINTPVGKEKSWSNNKNHNHYTVHSVRGYTNKNGQYCKEAETIVKKQNGERESATTIICRNKGRWYVQ